MVGYLPPDEPAHLYLSPPCGLSAWSECLAPTAPAHPYLSPPCGLSAWSECLAPTPPLTFTFRPHAACPHGANVWPLPRPRPLPFAPMRLVRMERMSGPYPHRAPLPFAPMRLVRMERMSGPYRARSPLPFAPMRLVRMERMSGTYRARSPLPLAPMRLVRMERMSGPYRPAHLYLSPPCGLSAWSGCLAPTAPAHPYLSPPCGLSAWSECLAPTAARSPLPLAPMRLVRMERMSGTYRARSPLPFAPMRLVRMERMSGPYRAHSPLPFAPMRLVRMERMSGPYRDALLQSTRTPGSPTMPHSEPIYTRSNCNFAFQLNWGLAVFWRVPIEDSPWLGPLSKAAVPDGIRILDHRFTKPGTSQFLLSTLPEVDPQKVVARVKGRLQYLVRDRWPKAFQRNFAIDSLGSATRAVIEQYVETQLDRYVMAEGDLQAFLKSIQIRRPEVDLSQKRRTVPGYSRTISICASGRREVGARHAVTGCVRSAIGSFGSRRPARTFFPAPRSFPTTCTSRSAVPSTPFRPTLRFATSTIWLTFTG